MAVLTNLSIPNKDGNAPTLMPKLQYRFRVSMGFDTDQVTTRNVVSVTRPSVTQEEIVLDVYNSKIFLAGKHTWEPITVTIRDDASNQVIKAIEKQLATQISMQSQSSQTAGAGYKFRMIIETLDGTNGEEPGILDTWVISGAFISNIQYGESNYSTSDAQVISITVRYDNAAHLDATGTDNLSESRGQSESGDSTANG